MIALLTFAAISVPSIYWYTQRMIDGSDEPVGVIALLTLLALIIARRRILAWRSLDPSEWTVLISLVALLTLFRDLLPNLVVASLLLVSATTFALRRGLPPATMGMALLSLPLLATLDFYLGFPLRLACGWLFALLFNGLVGGLELSGLSLVYQGIEVVIDRPCAGINYLWSGWYAAALIACLRNFRGLALLAWSLASLIILFGANVARVGLLFVLEINQLITDSGHQSVGLAVFILALLLLFSIGNLLPSKTPKKSGALSRPSATNRSTPRVLPKISLATALLSLALPQTSTPVDQTTFATLQNDFIFPTHLLGFRLQPIDQGSPLEVLRQSPSTLSATFVWQERLILLRVTHRPTRTLHPAEHCFTGAGYQIQPLPLWKDPQERNWSRFEARKGRERLIVSQMIEHPASAATFSDVSQSYWNAFLNRQTGPWFAWTMVEPRKTWGGSLAFGKRPEFGLLD